MDSFTLRRLGFKMRPPSVAGIFGAGRKRSRSDQQSDTHMLMKCNFNVAFPSAAFLLYLIAGQQLALAGGVVLAWDPSSEPSIAGYRLYYGGAAGHYDASVDVGEATSYTVDGLSPGTYYFAVTAYDSSGLESSYSNEVSTTISALPPVISGIAASGITATEATISWMTDVPSDSQVDYGTSTGYGTSTTLNPALVTAHSQTLNDLAPNNLYHCRVVSRDASGNLTTSGDLAFNTPPALLSISAAAVSSVTSTSAVISWTTGTDSDSQLDYGTSMSYGDSTQLNPSPVTRHRVALDGLDPGTVYHCRAKSRDSAGNIAVSPDLTFTTLVGVFSTLPVPARPSDRRRGHGQASIAATKVDRLFSFVLSEIGSDSSTRIQIRNPNLQPVWVTLELVQANGTVVAAVAQQIAAAGVLQANLNDLFLTLHPDDYVRGISDAALLSYESFGTESGRTILWAQSNEDGFATEFMEYISGGGWHSTLSLINLDPSPGFATVRFVRADGSGARDPMTLPIAANGKIYISDRQFPADGSAAPTRGYVKILGEGVRLAGSIVMAGDRFISATPLRATANR